MAKFSQALLQSLMQPSYQEGLFTAAQGLGGAPRLAQQQVAQQKKAEDFSNLGTEEKLNFAIQEASEAGDFSTASKLAATRDNFILTNAKKMAEADALAKKSFVDYVSNYMTKLGLTEIPEEIPNPNPNAPEDKKTIKVPLELEDNILAQNVATYEITENAVSSMQKNTLTPDAIDWAKSLPEDSIIKGKFDTWRANYKGKLPSLESRGLLRAVNEGYSAHIERRENAKYSDGGLRYQARTIFKQVKDLGSFTEFKYGKDVAEFLDEYSEDTDEYKLFEDQAVQALSEGEKSIETILARAQLGLEKIITRDQDGVRGRSSNLAQMRAKLVADFGEAWVRQQEERAREDGI